jgi:hypothetical protein
MQYAKRRKMDMIKEIKTNYLTIDNLSYETLVKIFDTSVIYDTNHIIVRQKKFSTEEIEKALAEHSKTLSHIYALDDDDEIEYTLNNRGVVLDLLLDMLGDEYDDETCVTAIPETIMLEQMKLDGLRRNIYNSANNKHSRYFNPDARVDIEFI